MKIFIVDDDAVFGELLKYHLSLNPDHQVELFTSASECISQSYRMPDVYVLDYRMPDMSGEELMKKLLKQKPEAKIIIVSGQDDINTAISLMKEGAYDYIVKDADARNRLWSTLLKINENLSLRQEVEQLKEEIVKQYNCSNLIKGNSKAIQNTLKLIEKASQNAITVSISGETGTGKELVAKTIHYNSERSKQPFVAVNMAAIPSELLESELFGYEKGAFTGATTRRIGKFEEAGHGTLFLDEVAELSPSMQAKLLRVLQERELVRIGDNQKVKLHFRLIVATHKNLQEEVVKGNFREDLYYRLLGLPIHVPPLRDREGDILLLAKYFIESYAQKNSVPMKTLTGEAKEKLIKYHFPGNVRELNSLMELAYVTSDTNEITAADITIDSKRFLTDFLLDEITLGEYNKRILQHFLDKYDNDVLLVAQKLDVSKSKIYQMIKNGELAKAPAMRKLKMSDDLQRAS